MEFAGRSSGSLSAKVTDDVDVWCSPISKKVICPGGVGDPSSGFAQVRGRIAATKEDAAVAAHVDVRCSPISKKAECLGGVGRPSSGFAHECDRIAAAEEAVFDARVAFKRSHLLLLAAYLELSSITEKHLQEIQSDKDEISRTERLLAEIESEMNAACLTLRVGNLLRVYTVSDVKVVHHLISKHAWPGKALICVDEHGDDVDPELMVVIKAAEEHKIPHLKIPRIPHL